MILLVSAVVGAAVVEIPYVSLRPGSVRPVTEQVLVEGVPSYPPQESIAYTTVSIGRTTVLEALAGWLDDDVDVLPEERVRGGRSAEENRRYNAQLMDTSKLVAIAVALEAPRRGRRHPHDGRVVRADPRGVSRGGGPQLDDVIVAVDGEAVDEPAEVGTLLQPGGPGTTHSLTVERPAGTDQRVEVDITTVAADGRPRPSHRRHRARGSHQRASTSRSTSPSTRAEWADRRLAWPSPSP